MATEYFTLKI